MAKASKETINIETWCPKFADSSSFIQHGRNVHNCDISTAADSDDDVEEIYDSISSSFSINLWDILTWKNMDQQQPKNQLLKWKQSDWKKSYH